MQLQNVAVVVACGCIVAVCSLSIDFPLISLCIFVFHAHSAVANFVYANNMNSPERDCPQINTLTKSFLQRVLGLNRPAKCTNL